jgi:hypothetical protein
MPKRGQLITGMVMNVIIMLVISQLATGALNPLEVFRGDSLFLKIVIGFFSLALVMSVVTLFFQGGLSNETCAKCGLPLLAYAGSHGNPTRCNFCKRWYHTNCFKANGGSFLEGCKHPPCPSAQKYD